MKLAPPYKNEQNQRYSKQLFWEKWVELPVSMRIVEPPFSLFTAKEGLICFREEYVNDADPSGYTTSLRIFGEFAYWKYLSKIKWFKEAKAVWDDELEAKLYSTGLAKILELARGDDAKALNAAKYLAKKEFLEKQTLRGRPSTEEVAGKLKEEAKQLTSLREDADRIRLIGT